ncbi:hypothetical protein GGI25_001791 [Coemansia spiralis]|uniref:MYND-type domain-containing protein n=1 Tax=Coemansia spiralis TaxID=417178 RepID=A0A9W8G9T8_9FUNG|nr:hypothetical protein GGI25_001791 [Coemansia spiralis]
MRESNFHFPSANKACVSITLSLYDRRALDCTADLPLVNSLSHLNYMTSSFARIREILTADGGLERLVRILRTTRVTEDTLHNWKWTLAFQCIVNVGVRGTAEIRQRVVQVGAVPILIEILRAYLLGAEVLRLEQKLREVMNAQAECPPITKIMGFAADPDLLATDEHAEVNDPSNAIVSSHILASGANHSTGTSSTRSSNSATARSNAQAAAAAAVAAMNGINPIPVAAPTILPTPAAGAGAPNYQQARHGAYPTTTAARPHSALPGTYIPYSNHAYTYSEQERLQAEYEATRRRLQSINHVMYRHDDVVLTLQLLAYLSKTPAQRLPLRECPLLYSYIRTSDTSAGSGCMDDYATPNDLEDAVLAAKCAAEANKNAGVPSPRRRQNVGDAVVDVFSIVEKFTLQRSFPSDMVYWSSIVMRNGCRRDESRNGCRQCAYLKCQKWETHPDEFYKCRRCRKVKYCSKQCQSSAWQEGHRHWCSERNPTSTGMAGPIDSEAAAAAAAASVNGQRVALVSTLPDQQPPQHTLQQQQETYQRDLRGELDQPVEQQQQPRYNHQFQEYERRHAQQQQQAAYLSQLNDGAPAGPNENSRTAETAAHSTYDSTGGTGAAASLSAPGQFFQQASPPSSMSVTQPHGRSSPGGPVFSPAAHNSSRSQHYHHPYRNPNSEDNRSSLVGHSRTRRRDRDSGQ